MFPFLCSHQTGYLDVTRVGRERQDWPGRGRKSDINIESGVRWGLRRVFLAHLSLFLWGFCTPRTIPGRRRRNCKGVRVARARSNRSPAGACKAEAPQRARPAPRQQARLRGRERERRATYAVCIAGRAGGGGGARAGRLGSARAGLGRSSPAPV